MSANTLSHTSALPLFPSSMYARPRSLSFAHPAHWWFQFEWLCALDTVLFLCTMHDMCNLCVLLRALCALGHSTSLCSSRRCVISTDLARTRYLRLASVLFVRQAHHHAALHTRPRTARPVFTNALHASRTSTNYTSRTDLHSARVFFGSHAPRNV